MGQNNTMETGGVCSDLKADIPMSPLWHMGKAAKFESKDSFDTMQKAIDYLACKAKKHQPQRCINLCDFTSFLPMRLFPKHRDNATSRFEPPDWHSLLG